MPILVWSKGLQLWVQNLLELGLREIAETKQILSGKQESHANIFFTNENSQQNSILFKTKSNMAYFLLSLIAMHDFLQHLLYSY